MKLEFKYYKFNPPTFPIEPWDYKKFKEIAVKGTMVDFYGIKSIFKILGFYLLVNLIPIVLLILLTIKDKYLPTEGAKEAIDFCIGLFLVVLVGTFFAMVTLIWVLLRAVIFNRKVRKYLMSSNDYEEFINKYGSKYY